MARPRCRNHSGVPLGGIGAGKVEFCPDGAFRNITCQNNMDQGVSSASGSAYEFHPAGVEGSFLAVYVEGAGAVALKAREAPGIRTLPESAIRYEGRLPVVRASYPAMDGVGLSLEAFSPLVLDDDGSDGYKDSALPAACFLLRAENRGRRRRFVSFAFSWFNPIGQGGYPQAFVRDYRGNKAEWFETEDLQGLLFTHERPKMDPRLEGQYALTLPKDGGLEVSYMAWRNIAFNIGGKGTVWDLYASSGRLGSVQLERHATESNTHGTLVAGRTLGPGETLEVPFVLSWHFPNYVANDRPGVVYRPFYTRFFRDAVEAARYMHAERRRLRERTVAWHDLFDASNLPDWLVEKLANDLFPLYTNTLYLDDGRFGVNESPGAMGGCMGTIDQRSVADAACAMAFPGLARSELGLFSAQQIGEDHPARYGEHWDTVRGVFGRRIDRLGAIRHETGWDHLEGGELGYKYWTNLHWPDIQSVYILQVLRHGLWTGDRAFFDGTYPRVKKVFRFLEELDQDGDGVPDLWGPGSNTYDNESFPYFGVSSFVGSLYLAALKAGMRMARLAGDEEFLCPLESRYGLAKATVESLWDERLGYYLSWRDRNHKAWASGERPHGERSDLCMVSQLAGQWFGRSLDLGAVLEPDRVRRALRSIARRNVGLVRGCPANEVSADRRTVSDSWPYYAEVYYAALAVYEGEVEAGLKAFRNIHWAMYERDGSPWNATLGWGGPENDVRTWGINYMSAPASWYLLPALAGWRLDLLEGRLTVMPNIPPSWGRLEALPVVMPAFWAAVDADPSEVRVRFVRMRPFGRRIVFRILKTWPDLVEASVDGVRGRILSVEGCSEVEGPFEVKEGSQMRFRFRR